jgi:transcriptional regulator with XRE-family HTH domain
MLNERLKKLRLAKGLTLQQVGDVFGISAASVASWEKGKNQPDSRKLSKIAEVLGSSVEFLLNGLGDLQTTRAENIESAVPFLPWSILFGSRVPHHVNAAPATHIAVIRDGFEFMRRLRRRFRFGDFDQFFEQIFDAFVSCNLLAYLVGRDLGRGAFLPVVCHVRQLYFVSRGEGDRPPSRRAVFFPPSLIACPCRRHGLQERHGFVVGFVVGFVWVCMGGLKWVVMCLVAGVVAT